MLAEHQQGHDVAGLDQAAHIVVAANAQVAVAAGQIRVDLGAAAVLHQIQRQTLGGEFKAHAVHARGG